MISICEPVIGGEDFELLWDSLGSPTFEKQLLWSGCTVFLYPGAEDNGEVAIPTLITEGAHDEDLETLLEDSVEDDEEVEQNSG